MAFSTLTLARLFHGFNCRSSHSIIRLGLGSNLYSVMAFQLGVVLLAAVLFVPGLQIMFAAADLSLSQLTTWRRPLSCPLWQSRYIRYSGSLFIRQKGSDRGKGDF